MGVSACGGEGDASPPRGRERTVVTFQGFVFAPADMGAFQGGERIRDQIRSAFGALRALRVLGSNRDIRVTPDMLYPEPLILMRTDGAQEVVYRVWYRFTDEVTAPAEVPRNLPLLVGGLHRQVEEDRARSVAEACTHGGEKEHARIHTVFDGALATCQDAMLAEQAALDIARLRLTAPEEEVTPEEYDRTFVLIAARLQDRPAAQIGALPAFEPVVPETPKRRGPTSALTHAQSLGPGADVAPGDVSPIATGGPDRPAVVVVPGAAGAQTKGGVPEEADPNAPPDPQVSVPVVVVPGGGGKPGGGDTNPGFGRGIADAFSWENLTDPKYLIVWVFVFGLYPLLRRKPNDK